MKTSQENWYVVYKILALLWTLMNLQKLQIKIW